MQSLFPARPDPRLLEVAYFAGFVGGIVILASAAVFALIVSIVVPFVSWAAIADAAPRAAFLWVGGFMLGIGLVGVGSGITVIVGARRLRREPERGRSAGVLMLVGGGASLLTGGGFFIGAAAAIVGGVLALRAIPET